MSRLLKRRISDLDGVAQAGVIRQYNIMVENNKILSFNKVMEKMFFIRYYDNICTPLLFREYLIALLHFELFAKREILLHSNLIVENMSTSKNILRISSNIHSSQSYSFFASFFKQLRR